MKNFLIVSILMALLGVTVPAMAAEEADWWCSFDEGAAQRVCTENVYNAEGMPTGPFGTLEGCEQLCDLEVDANADL